MMPKKMNAMSRGRAAKGSRELREMRGVRESSDAAMRFQGEELERERMLTKEPVLIPPMRPKKFMSGGMVGYDAKMARLDYPGTKGVSMPDAGKQQLTGKGFRGTF
jgi:hypothetical protein